MDKSITILLRPCLDPIWKPLTSGVNHVCTSVPNRVGYQLVAHDQDHQDHFTVDCLDVLSHQSPLNPRVLSMFDGKIKTTSSYEHVKSYTILFSKNNINIIERGSFFSMNNPFSEMSIWPNFYWLNLLLQLPDYYGNSSLTNSGKSKSLK